MQQIEKARESYGEIFKLRAKTYHQAMSHCPAARAPEFEALVEFAQLQPDSVVADIPSGGGYLEDFMGGIARTIFAVEPTEEFFAKCKETERLKKLFSSLEDLAIDDQALDAIVSLAGLHHVADRALVFQELNRTLKPDGILCIGDVPLGSQVDQFLNVFVHQHNSLGHEGWFIDADFRNTLVESGFTIEKNEVIDYTWNFRDVDEMVQFSILLFGLDKATPAIVLSGIDEYLGYTTDASGCHMNWQLEFMRCVKTA